MCSICGIVDFRDKEGINEEVIRKMGKTMSTGDLTAQIFFVRTELLFTTTVLR